MQRVFLWRQFWLLIQSHRNDIQLKEALVITPLLYIGSVPVSLGLQHLCLLFATKFNPLEIRIKMLVSPSVLTTIIAK